LNAPQFCFAAGLISLALLSTLARTARADLLPPEPRTTWSKGQAPKDSSIIIAGIAISTAVVVSGLLFARLPIFKSPVALVAIVALAAAAITGVVFGARRYIGLAEKDREKWAQWEEAKLRRRNGGGPTERDMERGRLLREQNEQKPPLAEGR